MQSIRKQNIRTKSRLILPLLLFYLIVFVLTFLAFNAPKVLYFSDIHEETLLLSEKEIYLSDGSTLIQTNFTYVAKSEQLAVYNPFSSRETQKIISPETKKHFLVVRVVNNFSERLNDYEKIKFILENEELPEIFGRLWIFYGSLDSDIHKNISLLLNTHKERYLSYEKATEVSDNILGSQMFALSEGFKTGAEWVLIADPSNFFCSDCVDALQTSLKLSNEQEALLALIPTIAVSANEPLTTFIREKANKAHVSNQNIVIAVSDRYNSLEKKGKLAYRNFENFPQEAASASRNLFLWLGEEGYLAQVQCLEVYIALAMWSADLQDVLTDCGFSIELN